MTLTSELKAQALALGFDLVRIIPRQLPAHGAAFAAWLAAGMQGEMAYLANRAALRADPAALAPDVRSIVMLAANYSPGPPPPGWEDASRGRIARYAWSPDYHDVIKARLFALDRYLRERTGRTTLGKACVDTAPFLERDFALAAGLGFTGKNTVMITPGLGSWTFLAALLVPEELEYDTGEQQSGEGEWRLQGSDGAPHLGTCGACTRCLRACPTQAFAGPYILDARRCISYLTIELRSAIPRELRPAMGNWVFGCDVCQEVCPYNRDPGVAAWPELAADLDRAAPALLDLLSLDQSGFRARYRGTAVLRTGRAGFVRNACVAAGNWRDPAAVPALAKLLTDPEVLVRGHAAWALGRIDAVTARHALGQALAAEAGPYVREEIVAALEGRS